MTHTNLQQTTFHMDRLQNVVNLGGSSAYQVITYPGKQIGRIGTLSSRNMGTAANEEEFPVEPAASTLEQERVSRFNKILSALKS